MQYAGENLILHRNGSRHDLGNRAVENLGSLDFTGLEAYKHVPKILLKKGIVFVTEVRFWGLGTWEPGKTGDGQVME